MALKALSKDEELAAVPVDQPVLVQLPGFDDESAGNETKPEKQDHPVKDGAKTLQEQLDALKAANALELKVERDKRVEAEREAEQAKRDRLSALAEKSSTENDAIASGLSASQSELASAKQALKIAGESGDWDAIGEAQARIGRASADIREYERAAATLADQKEREKTNPQVVTQQRQPDVNALIDGNHQLLDAEKVWLKAHPEAILDTARNKELDVAYMKATRKGLSRGTPDYFKFIEAEMGYAPAKQEDNSAMNVSAPVTRNERDGEGRPTTGKIMLSPEEREMAKSMGVTEIEYARQKANFEVAKKADPEKYGNR